jgi:hypothetical protein
MKGKKIIKEKLCLRNILLQVNSSLFILNSVKTRIEDNIPSPGAYFMAKSAKCGFLDGFGDAEDRVSL